MSRSMQLRVVLLLVLILATVLVWRMKVGTCHRVDVFGPIVYYVQIACPEAAS